MQNPAVHTDVHSGSGRETHTRVSFSACVFLCVGLSLTLVITLIVRLLISAGLEEIVG